MESKSSVTGEITCERQEVFSAVQRAYLSLRCVSFEGSEWHPAGRFCFWENPERTPAFGRGYGEAGECFAVVARVSRAGGSCNNVASKKRNSSFSQPALQLLGTNGYAGRGIAAGTRHGGQAQAASTEKPGTAYRRF